MALFEATEIDLEPGAYRGKLTDIVEAKRNNFDTGEPEACYDWVFEVVEEGYEGASLKKRNSTSFGPRSKNRAFAEALLGRKIEQGEKLDKRDLVGKECDLAVSHNETDRGTFVNIDNVVPVRKKKRSVEQAESKKIQDVRDGRVPVNEMDAETEEDLSKIPF